MSVGGDEVDTWDQFLIAVGSKPNREIDDRPAAQRPAADPQGDAVGRRPSRFEFGDIGVLPNVHPHVGEVSKGSAAERAGLKTDDVVLAVDGKPITFSYQLKQAIAKHPEQPIAMTILRGGQTQTVQATPARQGDEGLARHPHRRRHLHGQARLRRSDQPCSVTKNIEMARLIFKTLGGLFTRETSPKQLMGPIAIAQLSGESAQLGWIALITLMASISLNLGLLNLMPVPVLDGGHIFIMASRRPGAPRLQPGGEGEDADGRFCGHPDVDGDSHL